MTNLWTSIASKFVATCLLPNCLCDIYRLLQQKESFVDFWAEIIQLFFDEIDYSHTLGVLPSQQIVKIIVEFKGIFMRISQRFIYF